MNSLEKRVLFFLSLLAITVCFVRATYAGPVGGKKPQYSLLILDSQEAEPYQTAREAMIRTLRDFGYAVDRNLEITSHSIGNDFELGKKILQAELLNDYDVIFVNGTIMTMAAKEVAFNSKHNFIFACVTDPIGIGVIDNFEEVSANFTGVSFPVTVETRFKFLLDVMPTATKIGLIYAEMPQSQSYRAWIEKMLRESPQFKELNFFFRSVPFVIGENGSQEMAKEAQKYIRELDPLVDVFISPNDQMGVAQPFADMVYRNASKPLLGLGRKDVTERWGATMSIYPSMIGVGRQCASMIKHLFEGKSIKEIKPERPETNGICFDLRKARQYRIQIPIALLELAGTDLIY